MNCLNDFFLFLFTTMFFIENRFLFDWGFRAHLSKYLLVAMPNLVGLFDGSTLPSLFHFAFSDDIDMLSGCWSCCSRNFLFISFFILNFNHRIYISVFLHRSILFQNTIWFSLEINISQVLFCLWLLCVEHILIDSRWRWDWREKNQQIRGGTK